MLKAVISIVEKYVRSNQILLTYWNSLCIHCTLKLILLLWLNNLCIHFALEPDYLIFSY
jgi:hypothetical protein